ncbi:lipopolysaccharide biosynthesis protein [Membranihabitans maritimus]|uniref:lipopolysaccharide biosynthesis protein n=1 Tax=Membranihabitans maritimus TaxID=2904244 RepID=UPI001F42438E|nr:lipopolysaccharide biosynthesis protein [Membranihabitans maritimus]
MSLKEKTLSGLFWTFAEQFSSRGIGFVVSIILARILLPEEFGVIGMIAVFMAIGNMLVDAGMTQSLIRTPNPDQKDFSSVFFINIVVSFFVYGLLYATAPLIVSFYDKEILTPDIIRVYTISIIIRSFSSIQITRMTKEMNFRIQMIIQIPSLVISGIVGIVLAVMGWGVWSLVYMNLVQALVSTVQYWIYTGWRPSWVIDKKRLTEHFNFGYKLTITGLLSAIFNNVYPIVIGKYFTASQVGFYTRADTMQKYPVRTLSTALNKVTYPMFASIQDDDAKLKIVYKKLMQQVLFWITPALTIAFVLAEPMFRFLLTEKWVPAVPYFQILCALGILYPIHLYNLNILKVKGRSDLMLRLSLIKKSINIISIIIAIPMGIFALLYFQVLNSIFAFVINSYYSGKFINYNTIDQIKDIIPVILRAFIVGFTTYLIGYVIFDFTQFNDFVQLIVLGSIYTLQYIGLNLLQSNTPMHEFHQLVIKRKFT